MKILLRNVRMMDNSVGYVAVDGEWITYVGTDRPKGPFDRVIDGTDKLVLPGLYNTHCHAAMTLFRGYGEDLPLQRWLEERIYPAEDLLTSRSVYVASLHAAAEMIRNGIVSFSDMYFFTADTARAVAESGMKANLCRCVVSFDPTADVTKDSRVADMVDIYRQFHGAEDGRIKIDFSLHAEYSNTEPMCRYVADLCRQYQTILHLHLSETEKETRECLERRGMSPTEFFDACGVFENPVIAAHGIYLSDHDREILRMNGATVVHNPISNLKLGSGVMPLVRYLDEGLRVALGTDGVASNNRLDIFREMNAASLLQKGINRDPSRPRSDEMLALASENGAAAQGREKCGRLEAGYRADLILVDLSALNNLPFYNMADSVVHSVNGCDVCLTMADGRILYENGTYTTIDIERLRYEMNDVYSHYFTSGR